MAVVSVGGSTSTVVADNVNATVTANKNDYVVVACTQGPEGLKGENATELEMPAGETINLGAPIKVIGDGKAYVASNLVEEDLGKVIGLATRSALEGEIVEISNSKVETPGWNFPEGLFYLGDRSIQLSVPVAGFLQLLGTITSPTELNITILQPFKRV